jgi:cell division protein FtsW
MSLYNEERPAEKRHVDHILVALVLFLTGTGLVTLYSSSYAFAERFFGNGLYFISRQVVLAGAGMVLFFITSHVKVELIRKCVGFLVIGSIILCALTFVPGIGVNKNGAARWIRIAAYTYQPSELVKLTLPLYLAHIFDKKGEEIDKFSRGILPPVVITALFFILIYLQNNFATAVFLAANALFVFFIAGVKLQYFFSAIVMLLPLSSLLVLTKEHRLRRLISFINPEWEPQGAGYQVRSSLLSIISGGFWGKGIGQGTRKVASVPEVHSDFIFSAFAEESGFLGVMLFCLLFVFFAIRGYRAALGNEKTFCRLLGCGLVTMIISQALANIAVVSGFLPATGIPLPFFSAGGSSMATTLAMAGLIVNVSKYSKLPVYESRAVPLRGET